MSERDRETLPEPLEPSGDAVCWLHLVCESCGALLEREGDPHRPGCDTTPPGVLP